MKPMEGVEVSISTTADSLTEAGQNGCICKRWNLLLLQQNKATMLQH